MDTITHALVGGAIGYLVTAKSSPKKALFYGAVTALLPDLDIFIPHLNDLDAFTMHRSWTHSWIIQTLFAPILAFLLYKLDNTFRYTSWFWLVWLALITHSGLDALTIYGTQLFWPFMPPPISGGSIFIIDPLYTFPLLIGFLAILFKAKSIISQRLMVTGFVFSCSYLIAGLFTQHWIEQQAKIALLEQGIKYDKVLIAAAPLNIALWRALVISDDNYYQGFRSVFDHENNFNFSRYKRQSELKPFIETLPTFQRFDWFTHGFYALDQRQNTIIARDLRMGMEPSYSFLFSLAERNQQHINVSIPQRIQGERIKSDVLKRVWLRIWDEDIKLNTSVN